MSKAALDHQDMIRLIDDGCNIYEICMTNGHKFHSVEKYLLSPESEGRRVQQIIQVNHRLPRSVSVQDLMHDVLLFNELALKLDINYTQYRSRRETFAYSWYECQETFRMLCITWRDVTAVRNGLERTYQL